MNEQAWTTAARKDVTRLLRVEGRTYETTLQTSYATIGPVEGNKEPVIVPNETPLPPRTVYETAANGNVMAYDFRNASSETVR